MGEENVLPNFLNEYNKYLMCKIIKKQYNIETLKNAAVEVNNLFSFADLKTEGNDNEFIQSVVEFIEKNINEQGQNKFFSF